MKTRRCFITVFLPHIGSRQSVLKGAVEYATMRQMRFATLLLFLPATILAQYDILITNGKLYDGAANPWSYGDIAIKGDTIAAVGYLPHASAPQHIDAKGLAVAPGFIDIHSHGRRGI